MFVAERLKVPDDEPPLDPPTLTLTVPEELANVVSPEYLAVITCDPEVLEEKV
jgi:hypothetical protein